MLSNTKPEIYKRTGILIGLIVLVFSAYLLGSMAALPEEFGIIPLALVLGLVGSFIILKRPLFGFALMFFLIPLGPITRIIGGERTINLALGVMLLGIYGARVLVFQEKVKFDRVSILAGLFLAWGAVTSLWAYEPTTSLSYVIRLGQMIAMYVLVLNYCRNERHLDILILSYAAGATVAAVWALLKGRYFAGRLFLGFDINFFSAMISTGMIFMFYNLYKTKQMLHKVLFAFCILAIGFSIVLAQSRGVWIALGASLIISTILTSKNPQLIKRSIIITTIICGSLVSIYYSGIINEARRENVNERLNTLFSGDYRVATAGRTDVWKVGLEIVKDSFPFGVGLRNFQIVYKNRAPGITEFIHSSGDPHNTFLAVIAETGIVGFVLFTFIFVYLFRNIWRITDSVTRFIQMWLLSSLVIISLSTTNHYAPWFWFVLLFVSLGLRLEKQSTGRSN